MAKKKEAIRRKKQAPRSIGLSPAETRTGIGACPRKYLMPTVTLPPRDRIRFVKRPVKLPTASRDPRSFWADLQ